MATGGSWLIGKSPVGCLFELPESTLVRADECANVSRVLEVWNTGRIGLDIMAVVVRQLLATTVAVVTIRFVDLIVLVTVAVDRYVVTETVEPGDVGPWTNGMSVSSVLATETVTTGVLSVS